MLIMMLTITVSPNVYSTKKGNILNLGESDLIIKDNYTLKWENFGGSKIQPQVQYKLLTEEQWTNLSGILSPGATEHEFDTKLLSEGFEYIFRIIDTETRYQITKTEKQIIVDNVVPEINVINDDTGITEVNTNNIEIYVNDVNVDPSLLEYRISKDDNCENDTIFVGEYLSDIQALIQERGIFELLKYRHVCVKGGDYAGHESYLYLGTFSSTYLKVDLSEVSRANIKTYAQLLIKKMKDEPSWFDWLLNLLFRW